MEENSVELIDYLRVIWRQKILIIVGTLVCMLVGGVISFRKPVEYQASATVIIGKALAYPSSSFGLLDTKDNPDIRNIRKELVSTIPIKYLHNIDNEAFTCALNVSKLEGDSLIRISTRGLDRNVRKTLEIVLDRLIADHKREINAIIQYYDLFITALESQAKEVQGDIDQSVLNLSKMRLEGSRFETAMIVQGNMSSGYRMIRSINENVFKYNLLRDSFDRERTRVIGAIKNSAVKPKKSVKIIGYGVVGLIMSLFVALIIEYLGVVRVRGTQKQD